MKRLGVNRSRMLSDSCDIMAGPQEPLYPLAPDPHASYLLSPTMDHYGTLEFPPPSSPTSLPPECLMSLSAQLSNSATYPCLQYSSLDPGDPMALGAGGIGGGIQTGGAGHSVSMGMGAGLGQSVAGHVITSGSATISAGGKANRLDQLERRVPGGGGGTGTGTGGAGSGAGGAGPRNGFSTLQFQRGRVAKQRSESPGRIRHLMHSVQKLFTKSQSLEGSAKAASANGGSGAAEGVKNRRGKSKDRAKTEGAKRRPRSNMSGLWSSEDKLDADPTPAPPAGGGIGGGAHRNPGAMMTLGRTVSDGQGTARYFPQGYNTISGHMLKASNFSNELKCPPPCPALPAPRGEGGAGGAGEAKLVKRGSWSTLTLTQARQVCQKGVANMDQSMLKSKSCHQDLAYHYLQVPLGDWNSTLGPSRGSSEIPCQRMRSGSYVKAMGDLEDSEDSEGSPKPSPKSTARRQSYLKATQHSLSEQLPPGNCWDFSLLQEDLGPLWSPLQSITSLHRLGSCLPSLSELSTNRSLDNLDSLDCIDGPAASPFQPWDDMDFRQGLGTLGRSSLASQMQELSAYSESAYRQSGCGPASMPALPALEPLDLPLATCFRSRSQSYVRAIQAGCSQDSDTASADSDTPPPHTTTTVRTYSSSSTSTCITSSKKAPPPLPPRTTSKPFISVTVQSSTESAQDTYLDNHDPKSEANSQSGHSNSSDSFTSTRACGPPAKAPPAPAPREPPPPSSPPRDPPQHEILKITTTCARADPLPKRKLSSIGIQVDCNQPVQKQDTPPFARFQSIGVQVEDGWQQSRSNSMASKQETDSDTQDLPGAKPSLKSVASGGSQAADSPPHRLQNNGEGGAAPRLLTCRTSSASFSESLDPALDPSSLPPPDPWLESGNGSVPAVPAPPGASACRRDGHWFLKLLQAETARMEGWCQQMELETKDNQLTEEVLGKIRSAVGSAQLLMSQKFQQFRGLCDQNLNLSANPRPTAQDLAGFWDLLQLSIEDISLKFDELYHLKSNDWQLADSPEKEEKKQPPPVPKKPSKAKVAAGREKAGQPDPLTDKQRQEARKRLMAAKRAASVRQNSATESADSIEIYVPEAQTRL